MRRRLAVTIGLFVVLAVAGCGKDSPLGASAQSSTTVTVTRDAARAGNGGDSPEARLAVVAIVRRYQKDFIEGDSHDACSLLTAAGKKQMTSGGGRGRTCAESVARVLDQARPSDIRLIKRTRAGIRVDDVAIRSSATVDIGKGQRLRLARENGRWLISDPSP